MGPQLRSIPEASERLAVSPSTLIRLIKGKQVVAVRIGRRVLISDAEINRLMQEGTRGVAA